MIVTRAGVGVDAGYCEDLGMQMLFPIVGVDVIDGAGVVEVVGDCEASMLLLFGAVTALGGDNSCGSVNMLAARAGPDAISSAEVKAVVEWLAEPGLILDAGMGVGTPPSAERLRPLLRLLRTGRYVMTAYVPQRPFRVAGLLAEHWYDADELMLVPTDTWPPVDHVIVRRYQTQIEHGRSRPLIVELSPTMDCGIGYVLDGHHKLAAYQQAGRSQTILRIAPERPFRPRQEEIDRAADVFAAAAWPALVENDRRDVGRLIATLRHPKAASDQ
jgi:hypothetical protein